MVGEAGGTRADVLETKFRYPGPKPHTKEVGVLLLADAVEAAARTLRNPTSARIKGMLVVSVGGRKRSSAILVIAGSA